jgi:hypothetical protein
MISRLIKNRVDQVETESSLLAVSLEADATTEAAKGAEVAAEEAEASLLCIAAPNVFEGREPELYG